MSNWNGDWVLGSTKATYQDLNTPNGFSLQEIAGLSGIYKVLPAKGQENGQLAAAWKNCVLLERAGKPGPILAGPISAPMTSAEEKLLRQTIQAVWLSTNVFERLEGDVVHSSGEKRGVVLFKASQAVGGSDDFLVAIWLENLNGNTSPDGSAIGIRR